MGQSKLLCCNGCEISKSLFYTTLSAPTRFVKLSSHLTDSGLPSRVSIASYQIDPASSKLLAIKCISLELTYFAITPTSRYCALRCLHYNKRRVHVLIERRQSWPRLNFHQSLINRLPIISDFLVTSSEALFLIKWLLLAIQKTCHFLLASARRRKLDWSNERLRADSSSGRVVSGAHFRSEGTFHVGHRSTYLLWFVWQLYKCIWAITVIF